MTLTRVYRGRWLEERRRRRRLELQLAAALRHCELAWEQRDRALRVLR